MSKYNKGKKLPRGVSQRKDDGKFAVGFVDKAGRRHQRRFDTMIEADRWLYEMRHQDKFGDGIKFSKRTNAVDDLKVLTVEEQKSSSAIPA